MNITIEEFKSRISEVREQTHREMDDVYREISGGLTMAEDIALLGQQIEAKEEELRINGWRDM